MQANLYSHSCTCCSEEEKWKGNELFKEIKGAYCKKQMGQIELVLKRLYTERLDMKRRMKELDKTSPAYTDLDRKQTSIKIIINTMYGISGSPVFKHVFNINTASDCTYMARTTVKFARNKFKELGYEVIYTDTDSIFLKDPFKDEKRLIDNKENIIKELKGYYPFPQDTFNLELEKRLKVIFFFKKNDGTYAKKFYLYVDDKNNITVKGIPIVKGNASSLSKKIYHERIIPYIKSTGNIHLDNGYLFHSYNSQQQKNV
jgi:DNA polymerase elongation subunit (family B)